jgi:hypothetical protein
LEKCPCRSYSGKDPILARQVGGGDYGGDLNKGVEK